MCLPAHNLGLLKVLSYLFSYLMGPCWEFPQEWYGLWMVQDGGQTPAGIVLGWCKQYTGGDGWAWLTRSALSPHLHGGMWGHVSIQETSIKATVGSPFSLCSTENKSDWIPKSFLAFPWWLMLNIFSWTFVFSFFVFVFMSLLIIYISSLEKCLFKC